MPKAFPWLATFQSGELSPTLLGRSDTPLYQSAVAECRNFLPMIEGGVTRRVGTRHIGSVKLPSQATRLLPFRFTTLQAYVLEFGDLYVRMYRNDALITNTGELIANGTFDSGITSWSDVSDAGASLAWDASLAALSLEGGLGPDLVTNGAFPTDIAGWTDGSTGAASMGWHTSGKMRLLVSGAGGRALGYQALTGLTIGATYELTYEGFITRGETRIGTTAGGAETATFGLDAGSQTHTFTATATTHYLSFTHNAFVGSPTEQRVDNVVVKRRLTGAAEQSVALVTPAVSHTLRFTVVSGTVVVRIGTASGGQQVLADVSFGPGQQSIGVTPGVTPIFVGLRAVGAAAKVDTVSLQVTVAAAIEVVSPYPEGDLARLVSTQEADTLFLVDGLRAPRRLIRSSHTAWALQQLEFFDGPYLPENVSSTTIVSSAASGSVTLTASANLWQAGHVGSTWRLTFGTVTKSVQVTAFTDAQHVTAFVIERIDDGGMSGFTLVGGSLGAGFGTPTTIWAEGAWSDVRGWPRAVRRDEAGRILYAGTATEPAGFWGSVVEEPYNFAIPTATVVADDALDFNLRSLEPIVALAVASTGVVLQTTGGQVVANGGGPDTAITPTAIKTRPAGEAGGRSDRAIAPLIVGRETLLVDRTGRTLIALSFAFDLEAYEERDRLRRSGHLTEAGTLLDLARTGKPDPRLWSPTSDGRLLACTYDVLEEVAGWSVQTPAGSAAGAAAVESVAVIPNAAGTADAVWLIVRRTVAGQVRRDIERSDPAAAVFLDAHLTYAGPPTTVLTGLSHLDGETVQVVADGAFVGTAVVSGGQITLAKAASSAAVGLAYTSRLTTLPIDVGNPTGTGQVAKKGVSRLFVRVLNTQSLVVIGPGEGAAEQAVVFRQADAPLDQPPAPFTGDQTLWTLGWDETAQVTLEVREPLPATVLAIGLDIAVEP